MGKGSSATNTHSDNSAFLRHYSKISTDLVTAIELNETEIPVSVADFSAYQKYVSWSPPKIPILIQSFLI
jgi:hypothetical protein